MGQTEGGNMNEWIDGKADPPPPTAAKLPVLPIQSPPQSGRSSRATTPPTVADTPATPPAPAAPHGAVKPLHPAKVRLAEHVPTTKPNWPISAMDVPLAELVKTPLPKAAAPLPRSACDTVAPDPLFGIENDDIPVLFGRLGGTVRQRPEPETNDTKMLGGLSSAWFLHGVPSWLASFVFHLALILALALMTIAADKGANIEFVMPDQPRAQDLDFMQVAVEIDSVAEHDDKEKLLTNTQEIQSDLPLLDVSLDTSDNGLLADQLAATDALLSSRLGLERGDGKGASFFGTGALGSKFVFVVDCSGSMREEYRWVMARRELKEAILGLTEKQEFYVFLYNDTSFAFSGKPAKLMHATQRNKEKIFKWLDKQDPIGDTRPWKAMRLSLRMKPDAIFLLSDGELKDDTVPRLRRENREKASDDEKIGKIPVHTVSLGTGVGSVTMREIANENDGTFTLVNTW